MEYLCPKCKSLCKYETVKPSKKYSGYICNQDMILFCTNNKCYYRNRDDYNCGDVLGLNKKKCLILNKREIKYTFKYCTISLIYYYS